MATPLRVLCVHGVGHQDADASWRGKWLRQIERGLHAWDPTIEVAAEFLVYDDRFSDARFDLRDVIAGATGLGVSAVLHGVGDLFRRRGLGDGAPQSRGKLDDSVRWTAGMVMQWAADRRLREALRGDLVSAVAAHRPELVVAHSLGSLIAYDTFVRHPKYVVGRTLVTFGSQIGNPGVRQTFAGRIEPLAGAARWYHLFNPKDLVLTTGLRLRADNFTQVETWFDLPNDALDHDAEGYLGHAATRELVWSRVIDERAPVRGAVRGRAPSTPAAASRPERSVTRARAGGKKHVTRRALLVGINEYPDPKDRLEGCVNDCFLMSEVLQETGFAAENIRLVLNDRATSGAVFDRLDWLLEDSEDGDLRVLYYSGHGARIPDYGKEERVDHKDECLCTYDFDWDPAHCITDDRFYEYYSQLPYGTDFLTILDCCHSGGMTRDGGPRVRGLSPPDDVRHRAMRWIEKEQMWVSRDLDLSKRALMARGPGGATAKAERARYLSSDGATKKLGTAVALWTDAKEYDRERKALGHKGPFTPVLIQACRENEYSYEYRHGVTAYGAFTFAAANILRSEREAGRSLTIAKLVTKTAARLRRLEYDQRPQVVGPRVKLERKL